MQKDLKIYNTLTRQKEVFEPLAPPYVGMYVCGPTVYNDVHIGNVRTFLSFDVIFRYLTYLGYKVRYVRNITDVGHLENDADQGEDKIAKKAKLDNLEPMEVVQKYTNGFHKVLSQFNVLPPSIEPSATGHILEQIETVKILIEKGFAYEINGSVYFDVGKYNENHHYGKLSGRVLEELMAGDRELDGQEEKRNKTDFAVWKKAAPEHIMRWNSPWGAGFPGWHLECTVMSTKYLGESFDIHGGGMDLKFPHHECEIAQSKACYESEPARVWIHTNMLTVNGHKMSKSVGNSFLPEQLFTGDHPLLDQAYSPMTVRFFMLQSHYSSTLDISNNALKASQKAYKRIMNGLKTIKGLEYPQEAGQVEKNEEAVQQIEQLCGQCHRAMNDDFNTAVAIGHLSNLLKKINAIHTQHLSLQELGEPCFSLLKDTYITFIEKILGLKDENMVKPEKILEALLKVYREAKAEKQYDKVDLIRTELKSQGIILKDMKSGTDWAYEE